MLASKNRFWGAKTPSKIGAKLDPINSYFEVQVGLHVGGGSWQPRAAGGHFFGGSNKVPKTSPKCDPPSYHVTSGILTKRVPKGFQNNILYERVLGGLLGPPKRVLWRPGPTSRWSPTWTPKNQCIAPKLGSVLAPMLAPKIKIIKISWWGRAKDVPWPGGVSGTP